MVGVKCVVYDNYSVKYAPGFSILQEIEHHCIELFGFVYLRAVAGLLHNVKSAVSHIQYSGLAVCKGKDTVLPAPYHQYGRFYPFYVCRKVGD